MSLKDWLADDWVLTHTTTSQEVQSLLAGCDEDLRNAQVPQLSPGWQFAIAYAGALRLAKAALAASGYRVKKGANSHYRTIQSLGLTIGLDSNTIADLDAFRSKRHAAGYDSLDAVSRGDAQEILELTRRLRENVAAWLQQKHPALLNKPTE